MIMMMVAETYQSTTHHVCYMHFYLLCVRVNIANNVQPQLHTARN